MRIDDLRPDDRAYLAALALECGVPADRIEEAIQLEDVHACRCGGACTADTINALTEFAEECTSCDGDCDGQCEQCYERSIDRAEDLADQMREEGQGL